MAKSDKLFTLDAGITSEQMARAIVAVEMERWQNGEKTRAPNQPPEREPDAEAMLTAYRKMKPADALIAYGTQGKVPAMPDAGFVPSEKEAKAIGAVLLQVEKAGKGKLHPTMKAKGSDGKDYKLEPKELSAWLLERAKFNMVVPVDEWRKKHRIGLTGHGTSLHNCDEELYFEVHDGQSRVVDVTDKDTGYDIGIVTKPMFGYYGGVKDTKVGTDGDLLDIWVSPDIEAQIRGDKDQGIAPVPYTKGPVFIMEQVKTAADGTKTPDELKIGFAADVDEFRDMMTSTWSDPSKFRERNEGRYVELTYAQYKQLKKELAKDPNLTLDKFVQKTGLRMEDIQRQPKIEEAPPADARTMGPVRDDADMEYTGSLIGATPVNNAPPVNRGMPPAGGMGNPDMPPVAGGVGQPPMYTGDVPPPPPITPGAGSPMPGNRGRLGTVLGSKSPFRRR